MRVNGREVAALVHRDGDGKARYVIDLREDMGGNLPERGELRFEVTTPEPFRRSFCWTGTLQSRAREPVKGAP